ncbi:MAG: RagB/SusD family nutrient uptake outer membrane protein [Tannerellaceae bacterium]|nr:RagB/SusD family nutrient uptake outer membrane protein [Tannerellaceae bacterium]
MKILKYILICGLITMPLACEDYLDVNPKGTLSDEQLNTPEAIEKMIIAAYSHVENDNREQSPWLFSDIRSGDAYKGGSNSGDMAWAGDIEVASMIKESSVELSYKWERAYVAISRANNALARISKLTEAEYPDKIRRAAEMRFLRSFQLFQIKQIFNHVVWVDETMDNEQLLNESNVKYTDQELWGKIIEDFEYATENLPADNLDIGRVSKYSAMSFLAKALIFSAYVQAPDYTIERIDNTKLQRVVQLVNEIQASGKYKLKDDFAENFLYEYETNSTTEVTESIFAVQSTHDDGTTYGRMNQFGMLSYPASPEYGCCVMHLPSQNLVNAFKTDPATGLPLFDTYNGGFQITRGEDIDAHPEVTVDPRLMHTVGMIGKPYKYDVDYPLPESGIRAGGYYGTFVSLKEVETFNCPCYRVALWFRASSLNRDLIRYDEVLLFKAEALIQLGGAANLEEARQIINQIRTRAKNSTGRLVMKDGSPSANFKIEGYPNDATWTKEYAWKALQWEFRLEMAMEARRGFDLVRWGIAAETLNAYYEVEKTRRTAYMTNAAFTPHKHEYLPIPNRQITYSKGLYKQNLNYDAI